MGFTGKHDTVDRASTLIIVDAAENPNHPPEWFVRSEDFAAVCPAPFFSEELPFAPGETLTFRYATLIADEASDTTRSTHLADQATKALMT